MEGKTDEPSKLEKTIIIDLRLTRKMTLALMAALLAIAGLGYLALGPQQAQASPDSAPAAAGQRMYYLTNLNYWPSEAKTACAAGYHMASLWEILDTSNLKYNTTLGHTRDDSGQGPMSGYSGWVRTGFSANTGNIPGQANCNGWTSDNPGHSGTFVWLPENWTLTTEIGVWDVGTYSCGNMISVWCIED